MIEKELTDDEISRLRQIMHGAQELEREHPQPPSDIWDAIEASLPALKTAPVPSLQGPRLGRLLVAAGVLVVAGIAVATLFLSKSQTVVVSETVISNEGMPVSSTASGTATLISVDGTLELEVDVEQLATDEGFYELWVAKADASAVQSLGVISGDGRFALPSGYDRREFPAVAISLEQNDGNEEFSGDAVLFGVLP